MMVISRANASPNCNFDFILKLLSQGQSGFSHKVGDQPSQYRRLRSLGFASSGSCAGSPKCNSALRGAKQ